MRTFDEFVRISYFFIEPNYNSEESIKMKTKLWNENSSMK